VSGPVAPVYIDGEKGPTLKGEQIAEDFEALVESYVSKTYARRTASMSDLTSKHCKPCEGGVQPLTSDEAQALHEKTFLGLGSSRPMLSSIRREFAFKEFFSHDELRQCARAYRKIPKTIIPIWKWAITTVA